jgi:uncharacterized BrkB/YihY/UPF0761 family membrane protein
VGLLAVPFAIWLLVSFLLPNRAASWKDLVPGAVLVACGVEALHLLTTLLLTPRLSSATDLYGGMGVATVILVWLYLTGRLVVGAAVLDVTIVERREHDGRPEVR